MLKQLFHASPASNTQSILKKGVLRGMDGCVYLAETPEDALKFMAFRLNVDAVAVFRIDATKLELACLNESTDHSEEFFKCKAYYYDMDIPKEFIRDATQYRR